MKNRPPRWNLSDEAKRRQAEAAAPVVAEVRLTCSGCGRSETRIEAWTAPGATVKGGRCPHCDTKTVTRRRVQIIEGGPPADPEPPPETELHPETNTEPPSVEVLGEPGETFGGSGLPDLRFLQSLHRKDPTSWIHLRRRSDGDRSGIDQHVATIRPSDVEGMFPEVQSALMTDSYVSTASYFRQDKMKRTDARRLPIAFVDLDFHSLPEPLEYPEAIASVTRAVAAELFPAPTAILRSGQGIWLLWYLIDSEDTTEAPRVYHKNDATLARHDQVTAALIDRIAKAIPELNPDRSARKAPFIRIPGSVNTGSGSEVIGFLPITAGGLPVYTLDALESRLALAPVGDFGLLGGRNTTDRGSAPARRAGWTAFHTGRWSEILRLRSRRVRLLGGWFDPGADPASEPEEIAPTGSQAPPLTSREILARIMARTLYVLKYSPEAIRAHVEQFALTEAKPPLSPETIDAIMAEEKTRGNIKISGKALQRQLGITEDEREALGLRSLCPPPPMAGGTKKRQMLAREAAMIIILGEEGYLPVREMVSRLKEAGFPASLGVVSALYKKNSVSRPTDPGTDKLPFGGANESKN